MPNTRNRKAMFMCSNCGKIYSFVPGEQQPCSCQNSSARMIPMGITSSAYEAMTDVEKTDFVDHFRMAYEITAKKNNSTNTVDTFIAYDDIDRYSNHSLDQSFSSDFSNKEEKENPESTKVNKKEAENKDSMFAVSENKKDKIASKTKDKKRQKNKTVKITIIAAILASITVIGYINRDSLLLEWNRISGKIGAITGTSAKVEKADKKGGDPIYENDSVAVYYTEKTKDKDGNDVLIFKVKNLADGLTSISMKAVTSGGYVLTDSSTDSTVTTMKDEQAVYTYVIPEDKLQQAKDAGASGTQFSVDFSGTSNDTPWDSGLIEVEQETGTQSTKDFGDPVYMSDMISVTPMYAYSGKVCAMVANTKDADIRISLGNVKINDIDWNIPQSVLNRYANVSIPAGCTAFLTFDLSDTGAFASENNLTKYTSLTFGLFVQADCPQDSADYFYSDIPDISIPLSDS